MTIDIDNIRENINNVLESYDIEKAILVGDYNTSINIVLVSNKETDVVDYYNILEDLKERFNCDINLYYDSEYTKCKISKEEQNKGIIIYSK